jgi:hypothetical protein
MSENLVTPPGFETDTWSKVDDWGAMTVPQGWNVFFLDRPGKRKIPWDAANESGYSSPEFKPVPKEPPFLDPPRVHTGNWAVGMMAGWKVVDGGLYQSVRVTAGRKLRFTAWAHAWSNSGNANISGSHAHDPKWSDGVGVGNRAFFQLADPAWPNQGQSNLDDAGRNLVLQVGLDPTGGTDAFAPSVVWGDGAHIYNAYAPVPAVEATAQSDTVTVFLRAKNLWGFMHNDVYWDDPVLKAAEAVSPNPVPPPLPQPEPQPQPQPQPMPITPVSGQSKLGAHVITMNDDTARFIEAGPVVVKFAGDWGMASAVPPGTFIIGRRVLASNEEDAQHQRATGLTPAQAAQKFLFGRENQAETYRANPAIRYWEGHNEPVWTDVAGMAWYADVEIERMKQMDKLGLKCVIGNFATGTPPMELWPAFVPACRYAAEHGHILGLHEYGGTYLWWMTGKRQDNPDEDCRTSDGRLAGWTTLRYRQVYDRFLVPAGAGDLKLVITEFGLDIVPGPPGAPSGAWRNLWSYWAHPKDTQSLPDGVAAFENPQQFFMEQLKWYDRQIRQDAYVIGATVFTFGNFGDAWVGFEVTGDNGVAPLLTEYVKQQKVAAPPPVEPAKMVVQPAVTRYGGLKLRTARNTEADHVEALPAGAMVVVLEGPVAEVGEQWVRARSAAGKEGWARIASQGGEVYLAPAR